MNKQIITVMIALALLISSQIQAFAIHENTKPPKNPAFFNLIVKGFDINKNYEVCYGTYSSAQQCHAYNGKQLSEPIRFGFADSLTFSTIYACVRDYSTQALACEDFTNTPKNPENITVTAISKIPTLTVKEPEVEEEVIEDEEASRGGVEDETDNTSDEDEWNDSCRNSGYEDGQNGPFAQGTYDHCGEETGGDDAYYNGFIDGCMDAGNTRDICEQATDAG
jgi:hypothetical protein